MTPEERDSLMVSIVDNHGRCVHCRARVVPSILETDGDPWDPMQHDVAAHDEGCAIRKLHEILVARL